MTIKIVTAIAVAASVLAMSSVAEAGGKRHGFNSSDSFQTVGHKRHGKRRHSKRHFHFSDHFYDGHRPYRTCRRLKRKAYYTGSRYWWKKYRRCASRYAY